MQSYERLEQEFGQYVGNPNIVVCSSGTSALQLALETLRLPKGSKVLVPEFTMIACARAVTMAGLVPEFIDCTDDLLMDPKLLEPYRSDPNVRAVMPVHIYGRRCPTEQILALAAKHGWTVIEDCAEAPTVSSPECDASCWSFYQNKIIAGAEGGAVAFKTSNHARLARRLRCMGFTEGHDFLHLAGGFNARISNAHALLISRSLMHVGANLKRRREIKVIYDSAIPQEWQMPSRNNVWVYDIKLPEDVGTQQIISDLNALGIAARLAFRPMSEQPEYRRDGYQQLNAYQLSQRVIYLPVDLAMDDCRVAWIAREAVELIRGFPTG